jgi:putative hydrolase of the HAD superfamily
MRLQHLLASHQLGLHKPDPAIYRAFERRVQCLAQEILFFDDLEENVQSARSVGWQAELIDPMASTSPQIEAVLRKRGVLRD